MSKQVEVKLDFINKKGELKHVKFWMDKQTYEMLNGMAKKIFAFQPDLIICTHIFCAQTISYLQKKYDFKAITAAIVTDYTCAPFWEETSLNYYFIPHKDLIDEFVNKGMDRKKLYSFGLPVQAKFKSHYTKSNLKKELKLNPNMKHILIMGGSMGAGNILETTLKLSNTLNNVEFTVVRLESNLLPYSLTTLDIPSAPFQILSISDDNLIPTSEATFSRVV